MAPWWHVAQPRSARHFTASFVRNERALSIACAGLRAAELVAASFGASSGFLGLSARADLTPPNDAPSAVITTQKIGRNRMTMVPLYQERGGVTVLLISGTSGRSQMR